MEVITVGHRWPEQLGLHQITPAANTRPRNVNDYLRNRLRPENAEQVQMRSGRQSSPARSGRVMNPSQIRHRTSRSNSVPRHCREMCRSAGCHAPHHGGAPARAGGAATIATAGGGGVNRLGRAGADKYSFCSSGASDSCSAAWSATLAPTFQVQTVFHPRRCICCSSEPLHVWRRVRSWRDEPESAARCPRIGVHVLARGVGNAQKAKVRQAQAEM